MTNNRRNQSRKNIRAIVQQQFEDSALLSRMLAAAGYQNEDARALMQAGAWRNLTEAQQQEIIERLPADWNWRHETEEPA